MMVCALAATASPAAAEQVTRTPLAASDVAQALEAGPDGRLWLTLGDRLGALGPGSASRVYAVASGTAGEALVTGGDGALWHGGDDGGRVSRTTTAGATSTLDLPPHGLRRFVDAVRGQDGSVWLGSDAGLVRVQMNGAVETYEVRDPFQQDAGRRPYQWPTPPLHLTIGPDAAVWFVGNQDVVGRLTPGQGYSSFDIPHDPSTPIEARGIAAGPDDGLWVALRGDPQLVRMGTDGTITRLALRGPAEGPIVGVPGALWVAMRHPTEPGRHYLARVVPGGAIRYVEVGAELVRLAGAGGDVVHGLEDGGRAVVRVAPDPPPARCVVPRLRGLSVAGARRRLRRANCRLGRVRGHRRGGARVVGQSPRRGAVLTAGARVGVRVR